MDRIRELIIQYKFDVLAINETFLTSDIDDCELYIPGYKLARKDRTNSAKLSGGGVIIYIRDCIPFVTRTDLMDSEMELLWVEITRSKCKPLLIASAYRRPDFSEKTFFYSINSSLAKVTGNHHEIAILGDFNLDQLSKANSPKRLVKSFEIEHDIKQFIGEHTRITETSKSLIDLLFVNNEHKIVQSGVIHLSLSDHSVIYCVMKGGIRKMPSRIYEARSFKNYNKSAFIKDLKQIPWSIVDTVCEGTNACVDEAVFLWERLFLDVQ
jgi:hypothetical protein